MENDFIKHPESFNSRCICQLVLDTSRNSNNVIEKWWLGDLKEQTVLQLVKQFATLCGIPGKVSKDDIVYTVDMNKNSHL